MCICLMYFIKAEMSEYMQSFKLLVFVRFFDILEGK